MKINQMKLGALLSYFVTLLNISISFLFTPFLLRTLGQAEYGLYQLIGSFVGYLGLFDFGLGNTIIRFIAKYRAEKAVRKQENFLALCFLLYAFFSFLVLLIGIICYFNLGNIFAKSLTASQLSEAKIMFVVLVFNLVFSLPLNSFFAILSAYEEFVFPRFLAIVRLLLRIFILIPLLLLTHKAVAIVFVDTLLNLVVLSGYILFAFQKLNVKIRLHYFDKKLLKEIGNYSFFIFLAMIIDQIYWKLGHLILGILTNSATVAVFAISMQIVHFFLQFSTAISGVFLPRITQMVVSNAAGKELTDFMIRAGRVQLLILNLIFSGFILFGHSFIHLWAGENYSAAYFVVTATMFALLIPLIQNTGISILQAKNKHRFRAIIQAIISLMNIGITFILVKKYGLFGAASGTVISLLVGNVIIINFYYAFQIKLDMPRFFRSTLLSMLPVTAGLLFAGLGIRQLPIQTWTGLLMAVLLYITVYSLAVWYGWMNPYEKELFSKPVWYLYKKIFSKNENPTKQKGE